jgi:uncharacterized membrane protein YedE/YeeE
MLPDPLFDDLDILPIGGRLLVHRGTASPAIGGNLAPGGYHRFPVRPFPIGGKGRRAIRAEALLEMGHHLVGGFLFGFGHRLGQAQAAVAV